MAKLFRSLEKRRRPRLELFAQCGFLCLGRDQMTLFDWPETADLLRNHCKADGHTVIVWRQLLDDFVKEHFVVGNQTSLHFSLGGVTKRVEHRAAQEFELGERREDFQQPRSE